MNNEQLPCILQYNNRSAVDDGYTNYILQYNNRSAVNYRLFYNTLTAPR